MKCPNCQTEFPENARFCNRYSETQAIGKLGDLPDTVSIFDTGEHEGQPYIVIFFMAVGDIEELIDKAFDAEGLISKVAI
jgi:hypothetical protein